MQRTNVQLELAQLLGDTDRAPGAPLLGFVAGTIMSLALWALLSWFVFQLLR